MPPPFRFFLAMPFLLAATLLAIPSSLCMYMAKLIEGQS